MPHLFLLNRPNLIPPSPSLSYVPRIYGFRINKESVYHRGTRERSDRGTRDGPGSLEKSGRRGTAASSKGSGKKSPGGSGVSPSSGRVVGWFVALCCSSQVESNRSVVFDEQHRERWYITVQLVAVPFFISYVMKSCNEQRRRIWLL